ncbi:ChaB family protein [bacterium]|nr:ChaB family protein [bacterium]
MPYKKIKDLPKPVQDHLPKHAQEIYLAAFNNALEHYKSEETARKVAWSAVKHGYAKGDDGNWHRRAS